MIPLPPPTSSSLSGETSSYRSNPLKLAEFTLSRKDPTMSQERRKYARWSFCARKIPLIPAVQELLGGYDAARTGLGTLVMALSRATVRPGNRPPPVSACWAAWPTWPKIMRPSAIAPTSSTGGCCPLWPTVLTIPASSRGPPVPARHPRPAGVAGGIPRGRPHSGRRPYRPYPAPAQLSREERDIILAGCLINYYAK
jgi:aconitate hydratase